MTLGDNNAALKLNNLRQHISKYRPRLNLVQALSKRVVLKMLYYSFGTIVSEDLTQNGVCSSCVPSLS